MEAKAIFERLQSDKSFRIFALDPSRPGQGYNDLRVYLNDQQRGMNQVGWVDFIESLEEPLGEKDAYVVSTMEALHESLDTAPTAISEAADIQIAEDKGRHSEMERAETGRPLEIEAAVTPPDDDLRNTELLPELHVHVATTATNPPQASARPNLSSRCRLSRSSDSDEAATANSSATATASPQQASIRPGLSSRLRSSCRLSGKSSSTPRILRWSTSGGDSSTTHAVCTTSDPSASESPPVGSMNTIGNEASVGKNARVKEAVSKMPDFSKILPTNYRKKFDVTAAEHRTNHENNDGKLSVQIDQRNSTAEVDEEVATQVHAYALSQMKAEREAARRAKAATEKAHADRAEAERRALDALEAAQAERAEAERRALDALEAAQAERAEAERRANDALQDCSQEDEMLAKLKEIERQNELRFARMEEALNRQARQSLTIGQEPAEPSQAAASTTNDVHPLQGAMQQVQGWLSGWFASPIEQNRAAEADGDAQMASLNA